MDNEIGPIGGWNGLWMYGSFDVIAENNTIFDTNREAIIAGEYGSNAPAPSAARAFLANNTISTDPATCSSSLHFGRVHLSGCFCIQVRIDNVRQ